jgi:AcrR family transcriptional regulator
MVEAIVAAAARLLESAAPEELSTARIAERAGVSVGSLYQYFGGKRAILAQLVEDKLRADVDAVVAEVQRDGDGTLDDFVRRSVSIVIALHRKQRGLYSHILPLVPLLGRTALVRRGVAEARRAVERALGRYEGELREVDRELAVFLGGSAIEATVHAAVRERPELLDDPRFAEELTLLVSSYLRKPTPSGRTDDEGVEPRAE